MMASRVYLDEYEKKARFIGEIVGQLDLALEKIDIEVEEVDLLSRVRDWALPALRGIIGIDNEAVEKYLQAMDRLYPKLPKQIIHRDPNPSNIIVSGDKWGFIDFDLSERNARIYDPCYAATAILSETYEEGNEEKLNKWITVMKEIAYGYDAVAHLSEEEKEAIPYVILSNQFIATAWFAGKEKFKSIFEVNVKMTNWILQNMELMKL